MIGEHTFEFHGLDEFQNKLNIIHERFPHKEEDALNDGIERVKKISKDLTPRRKGKGKHLRSGYRTKEAHWDGTELKATMTNIRPHFHLVEKGHRLVNKKGEEIGFVEGKHMVKRAMEQMENEFPKIVENILDEVLR